MEKEGEMCSIRRIAINGEIHFHIQEIKKEWLITMLLLRISHGMGIAL